MVPNVVGGSVMPDRTKGRTGDGAELVAVGRVTRRRLEREL